MNVWWIVVRRWLLFERRKFSIFSNFIFGRTSSMRWRFTPERHGRAESNGIFAAAKMTHRSSPQRASSPEPRLATIEPSRSWGTRLWWCQMWALWSFLDETGWCFLPWPTIGAVRLRRSWGTRLWWVMRRWSLFWGAVYCWWGCLREGDS